MSSMRIHVVQTGTITGSEKFMRAAKRSEILGALLTGRTFEFPVYAFVIEHDDGHIVVDTGLSSRAKKLPPPLSRLLQLNPIRAEEEIGPAMRAKGLRPEDVRLVIPTHLDVDHAGGVGHFPNAEVIVHRPEYDFHKTLLGRFRYQPQNWPASFAPKVYDLDPDPYGPFQTSKHVTRDIRLVPIPGHSIAQVGVVLDRQGTRVFFGADHVLRSDWFVEDYTSGRHMMLGMMFAPNQAIDTTRRIAEFIRAYPTILVPTHDAEAAKNLAANEPLRL